MKKHKSKDNVWRFRREGHPIEVEPADGERRVRGAAGRAAAGGAPDGYVLMCCGPTSSGIPYYQFI